MEGYLLNFVACANVLIIGALAVVWGVYTLGGWLSRRPRVRPLWCLQVARGCTRSGASSHDRPRQALL